MAAARALLPASRSARSATRRCACRRPRRCSWARASTTRPSRTPQQRRAPWPIRSATCAARWHIRRTWRACSWAARCAGPWPGSETCGRDDQGEGKRARLRPRRRTAQAARRLPARRLRAAGHARRLRQLQLWLLCRGARRQHAGEVVHDVRRLRRRPRDHDGRRPRRWFDAASAATGILGSARPAVRVLHAGNADDGIRDAAAVSRPERRTDPRFPLRQHVPLHRLSEHREGRAAGCRRNRGRPSQRRGQGMSDTVQAERSIGAHMKRKEDPRFIRGEGNFIDDLAMPGMLFMAIVHSPYAHAAIKNIDASDALKIPGVRAVITGADLVAAGLGWLPTFHGLDKQMVLAVGTALYQYQEVAAVYADTREAAADGAEAVQVEYEQRDPVTDPFEAAKDEILLRADREQKTNHIYHWEVGAREATDKALAASATVVKQRMWFQRCHPAPLEPCGCVAWFDAMGRLQFHVTSQAPHVYRTALSLVTGIPEDKIHVVASDIGGGFGNKVPVYPGYVCAIVGALK